MSRIKDICSIATNRKGYEYSCGIWKRSLRGIFPSPSGVYWSLYAAGCLMHGDYGALKRIRNKHSIINYYYAWSLYFCGKFDLCVNELNKVLYIYPDHYESKILLADCMSELHCKNEAFNILETILFREKTWIKFSNIIDNCDDFERMNDNFHMSTQKGIINNNNPVVLEHLAMGAMRCGLYEQAVKIWEMMLNKGIMCLPKRAPLLNAEHAREALAALQKECAKKELSLFLISGTLLGLIRNGSFLSHDTDLDTGIFDGFSPDVLREAIYNAGCFSIMPQRSPHCIRVRHANGTPIDIFTHYRDSDDYWHRGVKVSWHNSPFKLKTARFLGIDVNIPDNPEKYLEENYGDGWRIPAHHFDSALDCPNSRVENEDELYIHRLKARLTA